MANKWFEETFLPSLEQRMNNPKYPNSCILSDKQFDICTKYMQEEQHTDSDYRKPFVLWTYQIGRTRYMAEQRGRYYLLNKRENVGITYVRDLKNDVIIATFETNDEYIEWYEKNVDEKTRLIKGREDLKTYEWSVGTF